MYSGNSEPHGSDPVRALLDDIQFDESVAAWESCCRDHVRPSRLVELAFASATPTESERSHIEFCDSCRQHYQDYLSIATSDDADRDCENAPSLNGKSSDNPVSAAYSDVVCPPHSSPVPFCPAPELIRDCFLSETPVLFPDGHVARHSWQFGIAAGALASNDSRVEEALELCCDLLYQETKEICPDLNHAMFVCFGESMHHLGVRLAARVVDDIGVSPHVVLAHDYYKLKLVCDSREFDRSNVFVLVDVIHSGSLLCRLTDLCRQYNPATVHGLSLIDQMRSQLPDVTYSSVWTVQTEEREPLHAYRASASGDAFEQLQVFDPNRSCAVGLNLKRLNAPQSRPVGTTETAIEDELLDCIARTGAMKMDYRICGTQYAFAVNVLDLLKKDIETRDRILNRSFSVLADIMLSAERQTCVAYHAGRSRRAGFIAKTIARHAGWEVSALGTRGDAFALTDQQCRHFASFDNVVIVDAAIRTGDSMAAIASALAREKMVAEPRIIGFTVLNSLSEVDLDSLSKEIGVELRSAYRLPLAPPSDQIRHWTRLQKTLIGNEVLDHRSSESVKRVLSEYCLPRQFARSFGEPLRTDKLSEVLAEAASVALKEHDVADRISTACLGSSAKAIRHLEVEAVANDRTAQAMLNGIMFNSMSPQMKESAAVALAAANRYDWMTGHWLRVNEAFLSSRSAAWKCVVLIERLMSMSGYHRELRVFRDAAEEHLQYLEERRARRMPEKSQRKLFHDVTDSTESSAERQHNTVVERLQTFVEAAEV